MFSRPAADSDHFRMIGVADDQDIFAGSTLLLDNVVYLLYKGACGVYNADSFGFKFVIDSFFNPVRTDNNGSLEDIVQVLLCAEYNNAFAFQILYDFFIMDDRPVGVNRSIACIYLFIDRIYGALHPETEAGSFCFNHFHIDYLQ